MRFKVFAVAMSAVFLPITVLSQIWMQTKGPEGGNVNALAVAPNGDVYAGSGVRAAGAKGGIFRSIDNGATWTTTNFSSLWVTGLAVNTNGDVFATTYGGGVYRSSDNGGTWVVRNAGLSVQGKMIQDIAIDTHGYLLIATEDGVRRSTDNGNVWNPFNAGLTDLSVWSLEVSRAGDYFAGTEHGIFRSIGGTRPWTQVNVGLPSEYALVYDFAINSNGDIFAGFWYGQGVFRSSNNGDSWEPVNNGLWSPEIACLMVDSQDNLFAGTASNYAIFRSNDNGATWITSGKMQPVSAVWALLATPIAGTLLAGSNSGVLLSENEGLNWASSDNGFVSTTVNTLLLYSGGNVFAGTEGSGVFLSSDHGQHWRATNSGLWNYSVRALACDASSGALHAATEYGVFKSSNGGNSWTSMNEGLTEMFVTSLAVSRSGQILAGTNGGGVFRYAGGQWIPVNTGLTGTLAVSEVKFSPDGTAFAIVADGVIFRSDNIGNNWVAIDVGISTYVSALAVSGSGVLYASWEGKICRSADKGDHWTKLYETGELIERLATTPYGGVVASSYQGNVYYAVDGNNWQNVNQWSPGAPVLALNGDLLNEIWVGTDGRGVFLLDEDPFCGDANGDGKVNASDLSFLIDFYFARDAERPKPVGSADMDCDGMIQIDDIILLAGYIYGYGVPPCCAPPPPKRPELQRQDSFDGL